MHPCTRSGAGQLQQTSASVRRATASKGANEARSDQYIEQTGKMSLQQQCGGARANCPGAKTTVVCWWTMSGSVIAGCATGTATGTAWAVYSLAYASGFGIKWRCPAGYWSRPRRTHHAAAAASCPRGLAAAPFFFSRNGIDTLLYAHYSTS